MEIDELRSQFDCRRRLSIPPRSAGRAVMRLRRDTPEARRRWSLGEHGSFEMQAEVVEIAAARNARQSGDRPGSAGGHMHIAGLLWDPAGTTMARVDVDMCPLSEQAVEVAIVPAQRLPIWFRDHDLEHWNDLARAALNELCEELLWYASRDEPDADAAGDDATPAA